MERWRLEVRAENESSSLPGPLLGYARSDGELVRVHRPDGGSMIVGTKIEAAMLLLNLAEIYMRRRAFPDEYQRHDQSEQPNVMQVLYALSVLGCEGRATAEDILDLAPIRMSPVEREALLNYFKPAERI